MGNLRQPGNQLVPQGGDFYGVLLHMSAGFLQSRRHAHDGRNIFRPRPLAPLLGPALNEAFQRRPPPGVKRPDSLWSVELVGGKRQQVDVLGLGVNGQMPRCLDRVGVEQHPCLPAGRSDLPNGLYGANLVVGIHNGHQAGVGADSLPHLFRRHQAVFMDVQQGDLETLSLQRL